MASFASEATTALVPIPNGHWTKTLDAAANIYGGDAGVLGLPTWARWAECAVDDLHAVCLCALLA